MVSESFRWRCADVEIPIAGVLLEDRKGRKPRLVEETLRGVYVTPPDTETLLLAARMVFGPTAARK